MDVQEEKTIIVADGTDSVKKSFFGAKIAALNFRKLFNYTKGLGHYAENPILA